MNWYRICTDANSLLYNYIFYICLNAQEFNLFISQNLQYASKHLVRFSKLLVIAKYLRFLDFPTFVI